MENDFPRGKEEIISSVWRLVPVSVGSFRRNSSTFWETLVWFLCESETVQWSQTGGIVD